MGNIQQKSASKFTTYLISHASQQSGNYNKQDSNKRCTASVLCAKKTNKLLLDFCANHSLKIMPKFAFHCVLNQRYKSAQLLPWNVCRAAVSFSSQLPFYSEKYSAKISKQIYNLSHFPCLTAIWKLQQTGQQ